MDPNHKKANGPHSMRPRNIPPYHTHTIPLPHTIPIPYICAKAKQIIQALSIPMRQSPLVVGLVSRVLPSIMAPVQSIARPFANTAKTTDNEPPLLLLEGDRFEVSHNGIARTFYHLSDKLSLSTPRFGIEEFYHLRGARKTFVLRHQDDVLQDENAVMLLGKETQGLAPLGRRIIQVDIQEIDEGVLGRAGTGATTWESSLAMALYNAQRPLWRGNVLEIGAGVGVGSILTGHTLGASTGQPRLDWHSITLTDGNEACLGQCRGNIRSAWKTLDSHWGWHSSTVPPEVKVAMLDWNEDVKCTNGTQYDTVIACDVCYLYPDIEPLAQTIRRRLKKDGTAHLFGPYNRGAFQHLCQRLHQDMEVQIESLALQRYRLKPADSWHTGWHFLSPAAALPEERVYASKSQATILHVTVRHRHEEGLSDAPPQNMNDLD